MRTQDEELITLGAAAFAVGAPVQAHHLARLAAKNKIPYRWVGRCRAVRRADIADIRAECVKCGYMPAPSASECVTARNA